jgi:toxin ParE1/3/4
MATYTLEPAAHADLWDIWRFIAQENPDAAVRVIIAAYDSFQMLADSPKIGKKRSFDRALWTGIRSWHISGFERYHIFYRSLPKEVEIIHVCHSSRNIEALFGGK